MKTRRRFTGIVRVNSILPPRSRWRAGAPLFCSRIAAALGRIQRRKSTILICLDNALGADRRWLERRTCGLACSASGGLAFALAQFVVSNFVAVPPSDIVASLLSAAAVVALTRVWSPKSIRRGVGDSPKIEPSRARPFSLMRHASSLA
jgi:hypothetical protein